MIKDYTVFLTKELEAVRTAGLYKSERVIASPQQAEIRLADGSATINFCANNYLGLSDHPDLIKAGQEALERYGYGMSSVRFICGTQTPHKELEAKIANFLKMEDCILYSSCFDANTGLFETLLGEQDAIISDALNHASIIDGVRLCKAKRYRYANNDMEELEGHLKASREARFRLIATDGVFSMDGRFANLQAICDLADQYDAMVMVDDSHAVGFIGEHGRGTPELCGVEDRVDVITGTLGKALGGGSGGYTAAKREIVEWLRQKSRPYLFSNSLAPVVVGASLCAIDLLQSSDALRSKLRVNTKTFRKEMCALGFKVAGDDHPIAPIMLGDAKLASQMAQSLLDEGIYVIGFSFPVVPKGEARIRTQLSAAHEPEHIERAIKAFAKVGRDLGVIN
jgi:glycine C-acetyltransferase